MGTIPRCSDDSEFSRVLCQTELLPPSGAHFVDLIFQKCSERLSSEQFWRANQVPATECHFLTFWTANCLSPQSCALLSTLPDRGRNGRNRHPTSATPRTTLPEKTQGFAPESVFTREFTRSRTVSLVYCSHTRTAFADYCVDMMMTWWWQDWPWTFVWNS